MGRGRQKKISPEVSTVEEKATVLKNRNVGTDLVSENANLSTDKVDMHDENKNATRKRVVWNSNIEILFVEPSPSTKMARNRIMGSPVRRSRLLQNAASSLHMDVDRLTQEVIAIMSDDKDEHANTVDASLEDKNLEEQVQYLLGIFKKQHDILNALKSKKTKGEHSGSSSTGEVTYKSLYINSQVKMEVLVEENNLLRKKTDALLEENHQLDKKLEHALGKIEVFEKGAHVSSHVLEKLKGVLCSLTKGSGAANILSEL